VSWLSWPDARPSGPYQGIRYVDVTLTPPTEPHTTVELAVHLLKQPGALTIDDIAVESGGEKLEATLTNVVSAGPKPRVELEFAWFATHDDLRVTLHNDPAHLVHPFFASADFALDIHCPGGDCRAETKATKAKPGQRPAVDLLTKDYDGFVQLLANRLRVTNPDWSDLSPASLERVIIELISYWADWTSYYQDRVANEAFTDTATQRHSMRQHGILLGYDIADGEAATAMIHFAPSNDGVVPKGTGVRNTSSVHEMQLFFYMPEDTLVWSAHNSLVVAAWPEASDAHIATGSSRVLLLGHVSNLEGVEVAFRQQGTVEVVTVTTAEQRTEPGWVSDPSQPLTIAPAEVTAITFTPPLKKTYRPFAPGFSLTGNLGVARQGELREDSIGSAAGSRFDDADIETTTISVPRHGGTVRLLRALKVPGRPVLHMTAVDGISRPLLEVKVDGQRFHIRTDLHNSMSYDPHCVATSDEDGSVWIEFGDGLVGQAVILDDDPRIDLEYRVGRPEAGNCAPGVLTELIQHEDAFSQSRIDDLGTTTVTNVTPGIGAKRPEAIDAARLAIPDSLKHGDLTRAVTMKDYGEAASQVDGVVRAAARSIRGPFRSIQVLVDPEQAAEISPELQRRVESHLEGLRMAGREVIVSGPTFVPLELSLAVCAEAGHAPNLVRNNVFDKLRSDSGGFFDPDELSFAETVELGDIIATVHSVAGVRAVKVLAFRRLGAVEGRRVEPRITMGPVEVARLDADERRPENGRLTVVMVGIDEIDQSAFTIVGAAL